MAISSKGEAVHWTIPQVFRNNPACRDQSEEIPPFDLPFLEYPIPENIAFGRYFHSIVTDRNAPLCTVASWMHLTGDQVIGVIDGVVAAPNMEQLAVFKVLMALNPEETKRLTEFAVLSWLASGVNVEDQLHPPRSILTERKAQPDPSAKEAIRVTPPNLRMKVAVDLAELTDGTMIREISTGTGDRIAIDQTHSVERDAESGSVHYRCSHGKHRIDLFREDGAWYLDATSLAKPDAGAPFMM